MLSKRNSRSIRFEVGKLSWTRLLSEWCSPGGARRAVSISAPEANCKKSHISNCYNFSSQPRAVQKYENIQPGLTLF